MIKITFPDGNVKEFAAGTTAYQVAESISPRLAADCLAASVNGETVDMVGLSSAFNFSILESSIFKLGVK